MEGNAAGRPAAFFFGVQPGEEFALSYRRLLCVGDFSEVLERALAHAAMAAQPFAAPLTALHVIEHFPEDLPVAIGACEDEDW